MKFTNKVSEKIWQDRYQKNDETLEENLKRVAKYCSTTDEEEKLFYDVMDKGLFFPAGRTMSNAGIGTNLTLNNCYCLNFVEDSIEDIFEKVKVGSLTQKNGGGTGYEFSKIRPKGSKTSNDAVASGVVSFMNVFNSATHTILQGNRRGANMGVLSIYHPDIYDYLSAKSFDENTLEHFNLSIMIDDIFMDAVKNNETIILHYPVYNDKGQIIDNPYYWYKDSVRVVNAVELWDLIMKKAYDRNSLMACAINVKSNQIL
jgi:ribonucleoside-diphosphate reductase alpha chain